MNLVDPISGPAGDRLAPASLPSIALLSYLVSDEALDHLVAIDPSPAIQTQRFGLVMLEMLEQLTPKLESYGFTPIQDFPLGRQILFCGDVHARRGIRIVSLAFVNLVVLKHLTRFAALLGALPRIGRHEVVIVHGLHLPYLAFAQVLRWGGRRTGVVLTDAQGVILPSDGRLRRFLKRIDRGLAVALARRFDFGLALSRSLAQTYLPEKPVVIVPGLYDECLAQRIAKVPAKPRHGRPFRIVYFGGLSADYGVQLLLDALPLLGPEIELALFGHGPLASAIAERAAHDRRLIWGGLVDQARLIEEMRDCDLLVNARPSDTALAKMSSPSKLIEYAASGRPVLTTRLPSLAPDVLEAALTIDAEDPPGVAAAIEAAAAVGRAALSERGQAFQQRVRAHYSLATVAAALAPLARGQACTAPTVEPAS